MFGINTIYKFTLSGGSGDSRFKLSEMAEIKQACYDGTGEPDVDLWLMKMKLYCSTNKFEGKQEAHAIVSKLEGARFYVLRD